MSQPSSISDLLSLVTARAPEAVFVLQDGVQLTYGAFDATVDRAARYLRDQGVAPGRRVLLALGNRLDHLVWVFAIARCGAVQVAANPSLTGDLFAHQVDSTRPALILTDEQCWAGFPADESPQGPWTTSLIPGWASGNGAPLLVGRPADPQGSSAGDPPSAVAVMFTSGSSGRPKAVLVTHQSYLRVGRYVSEVMGVGPEDRFYLFLPLFHGNAQVISTMSALAVGASIVLVERFSASRFFDDVEKHGVTAFTHIGSVVPILLRTVIEPRATTLRTVFGGAPPEDLAEFGRRFGCLSKTGWGMTETGYVSTVPPGDGCEMRHGRPLPGLRIRIVGEDGTVLPVGEAGEMQVAAEQPEYMMLRYLGPENDEAWTPDGWFRTGDAGRLGRDGSLDFIGRDKNAVRRSGENIPVSAVEGAIAKHPAVVEVAVVGIDDDVVGQELCAVVALNDPELSLADLAGWVDDVLPRTMRPRLWKLMDELPKRGPQKVDYPALREMRDFWDRNAQAAPLPGLRKLAGGFGLVEGPVYDPGTGRVHFSDVLNGGIHSVALDGEGGARCEFPHRRGIGGMARHAGGGWLVSGRAVDVKHAEGTARVLGQGPQVKGYNDLTVDSAGGVYVGSVAANRIPDLPAKRELAPAVTDGRIWRVGPDGGLALIAEDLALPNGLALSPDEKTLYASDSLAHEIRVIPVGGSAAAPRRIDLGDGEPDGMAVAVDGSLWVTIANECLILRFAPDGRLLERYQAPGPVTTSLAFAGPDGRSLVIATGGFEDGHSGALYVADAPVAGLPRPPAAVPTTRKAELDDERIAHALAAG